MQFADLGNGSLFTSERMSGVWVKDTAMPAGLNATVAGSAHVTAAMTASDPVTVFVIPADMIRRSELFNASTSILAKVRQAIRNIFG